MSPGPVTAACATLGSSTSQPAWQGLPELGAPGQTQTQALRLGHDSSTNALIERYQHQRLVDVPSIHP